MGVAAVSGAERVAKRVTLGVVAAIVATVVAIGIPNKVPYRLEDLPAKDRAAWTMPLDAYITPGYTRESYAEALLMQPCLAAAGVTDIDVPWRDIDAAANAVERKPIRAFDLSIAEERGYHVAPTDDPGVDVWNAYQNRIYTEVPQRVRERCEAATALPLDSETYEAFAANDVVNRLSDAAFLEARTVGSVEATVPAWRQCMTVAGYDDIARSPAGMPTPDLAYRFSTTDPSTPVSAAELAIATTDATCRDTSGYLDALYDAEWDRQLSVPRDLADVLLQVDTTAIARQTAKIDSTIATLTPPRP